MKKVWKLLLFLAASCGGMHPTTVFGQFESGTALEARVRPKKETVRKASSKKRIRHRTAAEIWTARAKVMMRKYGPCGDPRVGNAANRFMRMPDGSCNWDIQRLPPDILVIHDTGGKPGMSLDSLSALQKRRLYDKHFRQSSGHFAEINGERKEVFWAYHFMIRDDGEVVPLLGENQIGWNSDDWEVNRRSVAIVLEGNFAARESLPTPKQLAALDSLVFVRELKRGAMAVLAHQEVKGVARTPCPGQWFYAWREGLEERFRQFLIRKNFDVLLRFAVAGGR